MRLDLYGENPDPETDTAGEDILVTCNDLPLMVAGLQVPIGDGEPEWGAGAAFLSLGHHNPLLAGYEVNETGSDGGFVFGSDADDDVEEGSGDCFESHDTAIGNATQPEFTTQCPPGGDGGWWLFAVCEATVFPDSTFTTNGAPLRGVSDGDEDGIPDFAEDDDSDGILNGLEDDDADGVPDLVNGN